jgi:tetratricopeptide (TPR) repeat protein
MKPLSQQQIARLQQMLSAAQQAQHSGLSSQAETIFRDVLKQAPEAWDVHQQLALLLARSGKTTEALKHFRLIAKANPIYAVGHANLANALAESGSVDEAIIEFQRALKLEPKLTGARIALGETLRRAARHEEAIAIYKSALDQDRLNHPAFNGLGLVYRDMADLPRALECFEHAVGLDSHNAEYRMNFGAVLVKYDLPDLSIEQFYEAANLQPESLDAVVLLAEVLQKQRRFDDAKECLDRALQLKENEPELYERRGYVYLDLGDSEHALGDFSSALNAHSERPMALLGLGRAHMEAGDALKATDALATLIDKYPEISSAYYYLSVSRKFTQDDPIIAQLQSMTNRMDIDDLSAIALNFSLGKIYDDCKQWDNAFRHYEAGNRLRNKEYDYQLSNQEAYLEGIVSVFNRDFLTAHSDCGIASELPILIVGMPRSGTTLTEQIISSHPQVIGAGEVEFWVNATNTMPYMLETSENYPECMSKITPNKATILAERYIRQLLKIAGPGTTPARITDKFPHNFVNLGLIATLFPNAQIINCKRNAMDNCLSIFFQTFGGKHAYAYDLANIGHHYKYYERLMSHWHNVLPGRILDINYEDTIADPEYWSRKLIAHVGLNWDDACLAPHKLERTVKTASQWQVRQPIYNTSVERWKHYEKHLGPLKDALGYEDADSAQLPADS